MSMDINKILAVSARVAFALLVACLILIFFPATWLPFDISSFREEYGIWLFFVMVLSVSILFSYIASMSDSFLLICFNDLLAVIPFI